MALYPTELRGEVGKFCHPEERGSLCPVVIYTIELRCLLRQYDFGIGRPDGTRTRDHPINSRSNPYLRHCLKCFIAESEKRKKKRGHCKPGFAPGRHGCYTTHLPLLIGCEVSLSYGISASLFPSENIVNYFRDSASTFINSCQNFIHSKAKSDSLYLLVLPAS